MFVTWWHNAGAEPLGLQNHRTNQAIHAQKAMAYPSTINMHISTISTKFTTLSHHQTTTSTITNCPFSRSDMGPLRFGSSLHSWWLRSRFLACSQSLLGTCWENGGNSMNFMNIQWIFNEYSMNRTMIISKPDLRDLKLILVSESEHHVFGEVVMRFRVICPGTSVVTHLFDMHKTMYSMGFDFTDRKTVVWPFSDRFFWHRNPSHLWWFMYCWI